MTSATSSEASRQTIERSPADVLRTVIAAAAVLCVLVVEWLFGDTLVAFTSDLLRGLDALPSWMVDAVVLATRVLCVIVLGGLLWWMLRGRRWRMLATVTAAGLVAAALVSLLDGLIETDPGQVLVDVGADLRPLTNEGFPSTAGIAAVCGVLTAAAPWLDRQWRRAGWALIAGLTVTGFVDSPVAFDAILAVFIGWLSGAAVLVAVGAPSRRPTLQAVVDGLNTVGVPVQQLEQAGVDARGSTPYFGKDVDGGRLFVKALGTDERSADVLFRLYRRLQHRNFGDERPFRSLRRAVEHEAFVALVAQSLGVRTPSVRGFATADPNGFVLAYEAIDGRSLDRVEPTEVTDEVLAAIWHLVGELRAASHRPSRPPLGERLPRRQRSRVADRLRLQRSGRFGSAAGHRRRRTACLVEPVRRLGASGQQRSSCSRTGSAGAGGRSSSSVGAERRDAYRDQTSAAFARRAAEPDRSMNPWWLTVAGVGLLIVAVSIFEARRPYISRVESNVFHAVNRLPDWLYALLWLPMQLGNLVVGTVAGLAVAFFDGDLAVAIGAIAAMVLKLVTERIVRKEMADYLAVRQRPGTSQVGALLRGDVPASGPSFPSGHVILVAAVGCVVTPSLPIEWWWVPAILTVLVMVGRVYVGAHNPLDVTAGLGAGLLLGGILATFAAS